MRHRGNKLETPKNFSPGLTGICKKLLQPKKTKRLGAMKDGVDGIQNHAWYGDRGVEWAKLRTFTMKAPYMPPTKDLDDASAFKPLGSEQTPPDDHSRWHPNF